MKALLKLVLSVTILISLNSCSSDEDPIPETPEIIVNVNDFLKTIDEGVSNGEIIGRIEASTNLGFLSYKLVNQTPENAISIDTLSGEIIVNDALSSGFTINNQIVASVSVSNEEVTKEASVTIKTVNIWAGDSFNFTKLDDTDPTQEANQDRITDNVWITRDPNGGQIYNAVVETWSLEIQATAPADTEWAIGSTSNIEDLIFLPFRDALSPKDVVGQNLVLHLISEDLYIDIEFTAWSQGGKNGGKGGFAYTRSTED